jgi:Cu+-exporting ATPase
MTPRPVRSQQPRSQDYQSQKRRRARARRLLVLGMLPVACVALLLTGCSKPVKATLQPDGSQTVKVIVKGGFSPANIEAEANKPLKIEFYRDEDPNVHSCDQELLIPSENVNLHLPVHESQIVEIKPQAKGEVEFQCGMHMFKGKVSFK